MDKAEAGAGEQQVHSFCEMQHVEGADDGVDHEALLEQRRRQSAVSVSPTARAADGACRTARGSAPALPRPFQLQRAIATRGGNRPLWAGAVNREGRASVQPAHVLCRPVSSSKTCPGASTRPPTEPPLIETRVDPSDGNPYTQDEFAGVYGGLAEWGAASPGPMVPYTGVPPTVPPPPSHMSTGDLRKAETSI